MILSWILVIRFEYCMILIVDMRQIYCGDCCDDEEGYVELKRMQVWTRKGWQSLSFRGDAAEIL